MKQTEAFKQRINDALHNDQLRANFRHAMSGVMEKRATQFSDNDLLQDRRALSHNIRTQAVAHQAELLQKLEKKLISNGIHVHWAETAEQANDLTFNILQENKVERLVKGKSMVTEEIGLNDYLISRGIEVTESDLGEFIIQLAGEPPSHIVAPAIHKSKRDIAKLFQRYFPQLDYSEDVEQMTEQARNLLRNKFAQADAGISGVNFAVAETGTLCLVENEGNGRLSTTAPRLHIALTGIEKVVAKLTDVPPLLDILTKSATGQPITTYFNMISKPRQRNEKDGPQQVHLILLDNGRSQIRSDVDLSHTLDCIRCGACINHCPVYVQVGGHAYGSVYPGPIGAVLEPQRLGLDQAGILTSACTLCGACGEVCPVKIPLPKLINQLRADSVAPQGYHRKIKKSGSLRTWQESSFWRLWKTVYSSKKLYPLLSWSTTRLAKFLPKQLVGWSRYRLMPRPAKKSLHEMAKQAGFSDE